MRDVAIIAAGRTPVGDFGGAFAGVSATHLGTVALKGTLERAGIEPDRLDEVIVGNILSAGLGQNVARQIAINAGCPHTTPAYAINKLCGSGLKSVTLAAQSIMLGEAEVIAAGGTENMSMTPYALPKARYGARMGNTELVDLMIHDALTDAFDGAHMGETAERLADRFSISREAMDEFAVESHRRAASATSSGILTEEIIPVDVPRRKKDPLRVETDEHPNGEVSIEGIAKLKPAFRRDGGRVTAANSSSINDGAAFAILADAEYARTHNLPVLATIRSYASAAVDPAEMGYGPVPATKKALAKAGMTLSQLDLIELNEAFAAQSLAVFEGMKQEIGEFDPARINVNGGAIALGHPVGASGTRILTTLLYELGRRDAKTGLATLCIGGGQGISLIVDKA
ncbi:MAG: acetyl-CoA C-acetyltransferase [Spirochaetales bacterium]